MLDPTDTGRAEIVVAGIVDYPLALVLVPQSGRHGTLPAVKVLHINDVARIGSALVRQARSEGMDWDLYDTARADPAWHPATRAARRALRGGLWAVGLARRARRADLLDVHGGTVPAHTRWTRRPYVLHLHGTDIRVRRYEQASAALVERSVREALDVYYTTPDLAEHTLDLSPGATLQPVVIDPAELPAIPSDAPSDTAGPGGPRPFTVVFPSRWDAAKGGEEQERAVAALRRAYGDRIILEGLDWGENAPRIAREHGLILRPRMPHADYVRWLAGASAAVGQMTGCMGVSEIEAIGVGVTTIMALDERWYDGSHETTRDVPVLGGPVARADFVDAIVDGVGRAMDGARITGGRTWVDANHSPRRAVARLTERFARLGDAPA
ncbi:hypothetical protein CHIBA101_1985 [Actinomyces sp. Chiba101]|uniref:hypothetical protein n=1 Tax=Actinomyces TaxID=1654 RepID=UPI000974F3E5|nr:MULTISPECIES: hypothetical protein [Actinomyces]BAW93817.1 hypothetical protein CHIBA101_1985 [Actinomyces sp. Chiba101]GAV93932.1 hypothetical protein ADENT20671_0697 [Actinomyces denticolens]SUU74324.1 Uncharacterised protein [Actinomyces denticolens]